MKFRTTGRRAVVGGAAGSVLLRASACGTAGSVGGGGSAGESGGYEYGASQDEINEAIADLEPVNIVYQVGTPSANSTTGARSLQFKDAVEEMSNGQIEVEIVWSMAVAGYPEAIDAVVDGRVDVSYHLVGYEPQRFPEATALATALANVEYSPMVGEMVAHGVASEIGWNSEPLLDRFEQEGVRPLAPFIANGAYSLNCNSQIATGDDLEGRQIRAGTSGQSQAVQDFGAVPTSMEFTEAFEAMQRGTIDCDLSPTAAKDISGVFQAAPHLSYTTAASWPRFPAGFFVGSSFDNLPVAYQQILFDSADLLVSGSAQGYVDSNKNHVEDIRSVDGTINEFDSAMQDELREIVDGQTETNIADGLVPEDIVESIAELEEKYRGIVTELGYEDGGDMETMDEWYDPSADWSDYSDAIFEEAGALDHRPGG